MLRSVYFLLVMTFLHSSAFSSDIVINEIGASSFKNYFDEDHDDSDWIELYNKSDDTINIKDYKIYDKNKVDKAWVFPDTVIYPKGFLRIFASDKDRTSSNNYFVQASSNTNFLSTKNDEYRFLYTKITGDFEIVVKVNSVYCKDYWATAGLMIRENLESDSKHFSFLSPADQNTAMTAVKRDSKGELSYRSDFGRADYDYYKYKILREGDSISYYFEVYELNWWKLKTEKLNFKDSLYIGLVTSLRNDVSDINKVATFSGLEVNGNTFSFDSLKISDLPEVSSNNSYYSKELHSNFKLGIGGETIYLWNNSNTLIDSLNFPKQYTNVSYGHSPNGSGNIGFLNNISPIESNSAKYDGISQPITISHNSGWYDEPIEVTFSSDDNDSDIYYTLDGKEPTLNSTLYQGNKIIINSNTSLKAKVIKDNYLTPFSEDRSYFINEDFRLPVLAITVDSLDLWDEKYGIFLLKNMYSEREIWTNLNYFEEKGEVSYSAGGGGKLQGNSTNGYNPQISLRFHSRDYYGKDEYKYKFWGNQINKVVDKLVIKSGGQDYDRTFFRDAYINSFQDDFKHSIIMEERPIEVYINGKYWGAYILRNRFDEDYIAERYDVEDDLVNYVENEQELKQGDLMDYLNAVKAFEESDLSIDTVFDKVSDRLDLDNFIEYTVLRNFSAVNDWPGHNHKIWNSPEFDNKWRFVLNDFEMAFGGASSHDTYNLFDRVNNMNVNYAKMYKSLVKNKKFKNRFINTYADYLNSTFLPNNTIRILDSLSNVFSIVVDSHNARWDSSLANYNFNIEMFKNFLNARPKNVYNQIVNEFKTDSLSRVTISQNIANTCEFKLNTLSIKDSTWSGTYFADIPIKISCIPKEGYKFYRWAGDTVIYEQNIEILPGDSLNLVAELIEEGKVSVEQVNKEIKVYPNPVSNLLIIELANFDKSDFKELPKIRILDVLGKEVLNFNLNEISNKHKLEFDISSLSPGAYIIKIGEITNKFIKL